MCSVTISQFKSFFLNFALSMAVVMAPCKVFGLSRITLSLSESCKKAISEEPY